MPFEAMMACCDWGKGHFIRLDKNHKIRFMDVEEDAARTFRFGEPKQQLRAAFKNMAYNQELDARIKKIAANWENTSNKKMFGGVCHLLNGNMFCGVHKDFLILRVGKEKANDILVLPFTRPFDITGRPMKGWVMIGQEGFKTDEELQSWLLQAKAFAETLPPK